MIEKPLDEITEADLQTLIDDRVCERRTLEYKRQLPGTSDAAKKEFLADVSSFANASGGDIVYGVAEHSGIPSSLDGLSLGDTDAAILRLESMARDGIRPRIPGIRTRAIPLSNSDAAIVLRVPNSWASPHRIEPSRKFHSRSSNGKYELDVDELRSAFIAPETLVERIRDFRADRIAKIVASETPVPLPDSAKMALHLIPLVSLNPGYSSDIRGVASHPDRMPPLHAAACNSRYNLDGFLTHSDSPTGALSYTQLFRNGRIEAVNTSLLAEAEDRRLFPIYEEVLSRSLESYLSILRTLNVEPPIVVFLTLLGVKGYTMSVGRGRFGGYPIDRDVLQLPEVVPETHNIEAVQALKPCFDAVWNASGFPGSPHYDENGAWAPRRR